MACLLKMRIPTDVMEPTIAKGSTIVVDTLYDVQRRPERWDIVVFAAPTIEHMGEDLGKKRLPVHNSPGSMMHEREWNETDRILYSPIVNAAADVFERQNIVLRPHIFYVKRVVGLASEVISFTVPPLMVNGKELEVPDNLQRMYAAHFRSQEFRVPENHVYVLSDNLTKGKDSRHIGSIPLDFVIGRVVL